MQRGSLEQHASGVSAAWGEGDEMGLEERNSGFQAVWPLSPSHTGGHGSS